MAQEKSAVRSVKRVPKTKTRVAFVDGPSLSRMRSVSGIGEFKFVALYQVLTRQIGSDTMTAMPPVYVMPAHARTNNAGLIKSIEFAGFRLETVETTPGGGEDDQFIIDRIEECDPKKIGEIVIVSADQGYAKSLLEKKRQGIAIYWMAAKGNGENGNPMIAKDLDDLFHCDEFTFVELAQFKEKIMRKPWADKGGNGEASASHPYDMPGPAPFRTIKVTLEVAVKEERVPAILHAIGSLMGNVSRLDGIVETTTTTEVG